jgi:hypothetical protein
MGGAEAVVEVLRIAGKGVNRQLFIAGMNNLHNYNTRILAGPLNYSPTRHSGMEGGATITYVGNKLTLLSKYTDVTK